MVRESGTRNIPSVLGPGEMSCNGSSPGQRNCDYIAAKYCRAMSDVVAKMNETLPPDVLFCFAVAGDGERITVARQRRKEKVGSGY